jgi:hypothetical protein
MTQTQAILGIVVSVMSVLAGFTAFVKWLVKHYLYELRPNGGGSMKDQINRLEQRIDHIFEIISQK